ncbi:3-keto-5-aminohexanoate cleavage protein [Chloroflexota bacterium]
MISTEIASKNLTARGSSDIDSEMRALVGHVLNEPKIPTMDKKLIIEASTPGHFPRLLWEQFGINDMPPWSVEELASSAIECVRAGAAGIHSHPRDPNGPYCYECNIAKDMAPEITAELFDKVYQEVDFITMNHAWHPKNWEDLADGDFITPTQELLDIGNGNKYIQGNVMPIWRYPLTRKGLLSSWFTADSLKEGIAYLEENDVKPLISMHVDNLMWFKNNVIDAGVFKTRPNINIQESKHGMDRSFADPMSYLNLISSIDLVKKVVPDCTIGLHAGGRNWLPMTALGIMLGVDLVRIGIEDQFWACPHKDEIIKKPVESVEKVVQITRALGRDIATPAEAREIMGIKVTS